MADVITRFKLETTQYDSKLRDASKGLKEYTRQAAFAGNEFGKFTQKNVEAARALGNITPSATNAKDKVKELVGAFNDVAHAYNALTKEQQQSDFGKAMAASLNQLSQRIREAKQELYGLGDAAKGVKAGGGLFSGLGDKMSGALQVFAGNMLTKAAGAVAQLGSEMADMVKQGIEMARAGEGVRIAFERLGRGDILDGLREATHGTVTDLELMKAAVKFNDFKLPVEELGTMLAFAQQKAKDTGQSVDYMVDSIVTGLGRKSLMILDNLGLSATEVKEKMAETGDMTKAVGAIIREQMSKAGDYVETAADRSAQANVSLQNKMEELGRKFAPLEEASNNFWTSMKIGILDVVGGPLTNLLNRLTEAGRLMNAYGQMGGSGKVGRFTAYLASASEGKRQSIYQQQQANFWKYINPREQQIKDIRAWQSGERNEALQKRVGAITEKYGSLDATKIQAEVDAAKKMLADYQQAAKQILSPVKADIDTKGAEQNVESLKVKLIELQAQRRKAIAAGDTDLSKNLAKQISQVKSDIKGLGGTTTTSKTKKEYAIGSIDEQTKRVQELQKAWRAAADDNSRLKIKKEIEEQQFVLDRMTGKEKFDPTKLQQITDLSGRTPWATPELLTKGAGLTLPVTLDIQSPEEKLREEVARLQELLTNAFTDAEREALSKALKDKKGQLDNLTGKGGGNKSDVDSFKNFNDKFSQLNGGVSSIVSGIQQMGVEIPKELQSTLSVLQGISTIMTGILAIMTVMDAKQTAQTAMSFVPFFAHGGLVHAATGYMVPGNDHSDRTLIAASSGELILNRAQQGVVAGELEGGAGRSVHVTGMLRGEDIVLVADRYGRRTGKGELAFWK